MYNVFIMIDVIADRIHELQLEDDVEIRRIVLEQACLEEVVEYVDEDDTILGYPYTVDESVNGNGFTVAYKDLETNIGVPTPSRVRRMVENVEPTDAGNIVFGHVDLFGNYTRKYVELDEEAMDEAEVEYEGDKMFDYEEDGKEHLETVRFKHRVQVDTDSGKSFEELAEQWRDEVAEKVKQSVYRGRQVEPIKVNGPVPDDAPDDFVPERYHVGDKIAEFDGVLLGNDSEEKVETVEKEEE